MKNKTSVTIGYPSQYFSAPDDIFEKIASKFKGESNESGCGFGQRDMHFDFADNKTAKRFIKECKEYDWGFEIIAELSE